MRFLLPLVSSVVALAALSCNGDDGGSGSCKDYSPPASFDAQNPKVAFAKDVVPIFTQSCAFSACHGSSAASNGIALGGGDGPTIHKAIVDVRSSKLASMSFVKPGDPSQSYILKKMDGAQCTLDAQCVGGTCGESMPKGEGTLPVETRDIIRRWIAQGAKND